MDSITLVYWALGALLFLLALRVPVAASLGLVAIVGMFVLVGDRATWGFFARSRMRLPRTGA